MHNTNMSFPEGYKMTFTQRSLARLIARYPNRVTGLLHRAAFFLTREEGQYSPSRGVLWMGVHFYSSVKNTDRGVYVWGYPTVRVAHGRNLYFSPFRARQARAMRKAARRLSKALGLPVLEAVPGYRYLIQDGDTARQVYVSDVARHVRVDDGDDPEAIKSFMGMKLS